MKTKILRNTFVSVGILLALAQVLAARPQPTFITFDVPSAFGTIPIFINPMGTITGDYLGADFTFHGFVRAPNGTITTFDAPGAVNGTMPSGGITPNGTITGSYYDADFTLHGFVRAPGGAITTFDVPGAVNGTTSSGINPMGTITGSYTDANFLTHGFVRAPDGAFITFDVPGAVNGTFPSGGITPNGTITGFSIGAGAHGFVRIP